MAKPPPNLPDPDDRCRLRGRKDATGVLKSFHIKSLWSWVEWDAGVKAPLLCHLHELEKVDG